MERTPYGVPLYEYRIVVAMYNAPLIKEFMRYKNPRFLIESKVDRRADFSSDNVFADIVVCGNEKFDVDDVGAVA